MAAFHDFGEIPDLSGSTTAETLKKVENYLFLLQEQLRFLFSNLGVENINEQAVSEMKTLFTGEVEGRIADGEERVAALSLTADHLLLAFGDADRRLTEVKQSVEGLSLTVKDKNGAVSTVDLASGKLDLENLVFAVLRENGATVIDGGNIQTGTISAVDIQGVNIFGARITGSVLTSVSDVARVVIDGGRAAFYDESGTVICGSLGYDGYGHLVLASSGEAVLQIVSSGNLLVNAADGKGVFIGSNNGTTQRIDIGNAESTVYINGNVLVNGTKLT